MKYSSYPKNIVCTGIEKSFCLLKMEISRLHYRHIAPFLNTSHYPHLQCKNDECKGGRHGPFMCMEQYRFTYVFKRF